MASDEREIRTVHSIWIDAVNAGDLARLLTLVAEDVVFLTPGQAPFGREEFSSNFMAAHQQMQICCTSELEEVVVVGEVAYTRSRDALSVTPRAGGKAAQLAGHRMTVYRKQRDGRWLGGYGDCKLYQRRRVRHVGIFRRQNGRPLTRCPSASATLH